MRARTIVPGLAIALTIALTATNPTASRGDGLVFLGYTDGYHVYCDGSAGVAQARLPQPVDGLVVGADIAMARTPAGFYAIGAIGGTVRMERLPFFSVTSTTAGDRLLVVQADRQTWIVSLKSDGFDVRSVSWMTPSAITTSGRLVYATFATGGVLYAATPQGLAMQPVGRPAAVNLGRDVAVLSGPSSVTVYTLGDAGFHTATEAHSPSVVLLGGGPKANARQATAFDSLWRESDLPRR